MCFHHWKQLSHIIKGLYKLKTKTKNPGNTPMAKKCKSLYDSFYLKFKEAKMNNVLFRNIYISGEIKKQENSKHRIENSDYLSVGEGKRID